MKRSGGDIEFTTERPEDGPAIERLLDRKFGVNRRRIATYRFRDGIAPVRELCVVARAGDALVGSVRYWPVTVGRNRIPALLLGPMAHGPGAFDETVEMPLAWRTLDMAAWARHRIVITCCATDMYPRLGFKPAASLGIVLPGCPAEHVYVKELVRGALEGVRGVVWPVRRLRWAESRALPDRFSLTGGRMSRLGGRSAPHFALHATVQSA